MSVDLGAVPGGLVLLLPPLGGRLVVVGNLELGRAGSFPRRFPVQVGSHGWVKKGVSVFTFEFGGQVPFDKISVLSRFSDRSML